MIDHAILVVVLETSIIIQATVGHYLDTGDVLERIHFALVQFEFEDMILGEIAVDLIISFESTINGCGFADIAYHIASEGVVESYIDLLINGDGGIDIAVIEELFVEWEHEGGVVRVVDRASA